MDLRLLSTWVLLWGLGWLSSLIDVGSLFLSLLNIRGLRHNSKLLLLLLLHQAEVLLASTSDGASAGPAGARKRSPRAASSGAGTLQAGRGCRLSPSSKAISCGTQLVLE